MNTRIYREADWPYICEIYDLAKPDELAGVVAPEHIPPLETDAEMKRLFVASKIVVAEINAKPVGFVGSRGTFITWLFVLPAFRRSGVATALLHHVLAELERPIALNVATSNGAARLLYERLGFQVEREFMSDFQGTPCGVARLCLN